LDKGPQEKVGPIYPNEERRMIVRAFVDAYLRGAVKIIHFGSASKESDMEGRRDFLRAVTVVTGARDPDPSADEMHSINYLFGFIVASRIGQRIEGQFLEVPIDFDSRLIKVENALENEVKSLSRILSLILQWIRMYQPVLDEAAKDYTGKLGRVKKLEKRD